MAALSTAGKFGRLSLRRLRWGIRGSLFAAFAAIAGMAILISIGAGLVLGQLGEMMIDLSGRDIPRLAASLQLATRSAALASQGPALLASRSEEALQERTKAMKATQEIALRKLGEVIELGADKDVVAALNETVKNIDDTIKSLGAAAKERSMPRPARKTVSGAAQRPGRLRRRRQSGDDGRAVRINAILGSGQPLAGRRHGSLTNGRATRQRHLLQQPDGVRHDGRAVG